MPMKTSSTKQPNKTRNLPSGGKVKATKPKNERELSFVGEYAKYFTAPPVTPSGFHILDLTDGASVSTSSHT